MRGAQIRVAAVVLMACLASGFAATDGNRAVLERIARGIRSRSAASRLGEGLEGAAWSARAEAARIFHWEAAPVLRTGKDQPAPAIPGIEASLGNPDFTGRAAYIGDSPVSGGFGLDVNLINSERRRIGMMERLSAQARQRAALLEAESLLDGLKDALSRRVALDRIVAVIAEREAFRGTVDSVLSALRVFIEGSLVSRNSVNNARALREANEASLVYLRADSALLLKGVREAGWPDTSDFLALDIRALADSLEAARRTRRVGRSAYRNRGDSLAAEMALTALDLERTRERRLSLGLEFRKRGEPGAADAGDDIGLRLEWKAAFGETSARAVHPAVPVLPQYAGEATDPLILEGPAAATESACRSLRASLEGRLAEIRLGQTSSVYALSESLGYLLGQRLQAIDFASAYRRDLLASIVSLEEVGLGRPLP